MKMAKVKFRVFLVLVIGATLLVGSACALAAVTPMGDHTPDHITLTWSGDPERTQTITWRTDISVAAGGSVQYAEGSSLSGAVKTAGATVESFSTDAGMMNLHSVVLTGLKPGTSYSYRVGDGTNWSDSHTFTTETHNAHSFKFLIFGDSQSGGATNYDYTQWGTTVHNAFNANSDARFFVNVGDLVELGLVYAHWNPWFDNAKGVIDTIPAMPVPGNHETYKPDEVSDLPSYFTGQFKLPANGPGALKGQVYSYDYGDVHFVVLNSQSEEEGALVPNFLDLQKAWLENDLRNTGKLWKVVFFHKTPYYSKYSRTNEDIKAAFVPILEKYHADIVFNGHDHVVFRTYPIKDGQYVRDLSRGTVYYGTGRSSLKYYKDVDKKVWDSFFYSPSDKPNYVVAEVNGDRMTVKAVAQDGTVIDTYAIAKANGQDTPSTVLPVKAVKTGLAVYGDVVPSAAQPIIAERISSGSSGQNKWYIPLQVFVDYLQNDPKLHAHGVYSMSGNQITFTLGSPSTTTIQITVNSTAAVLNGNAVTLAEPVIIQCGTALISVDDVQKLLGFTYEYQPQVNMLLLTK